MSNVLNEGDGKGGGDLVDDNSNICATNRIQENNDQLKVEIKKIIIKDSPEDIVQVNESGETANFQEINTVKEVEDKKEQLKADSKKIEKSFPEKIGQLNKSGETANFQKINTVKEVQDYKYRLKVKAESLIFKGFPHKIVQLNELLETPYFQNRNFADVHQEVNIPVPEAVSFKSPKRSPSNILVRSSSNSSDTTLGGRMVYDLSETVPCNKFICELIALIKPKIWELLEDSKLLKMWISMMIPKIEGGSNFGVRIQEVTRSELRIFELKAAVLQINISNYFSSRAKLVSKVTQYPHIDDYRRAVQELDAEEHFGLWSDLCEMRDSYCRLHDVIIKNLEKIKKPRSSHTESMY